MSEKDQTHLKLERWDTDHEDHNQHDEASEDQQHGKSRSSGVRFDTVVSIPSVCHRRGAEHEGPEVDQENAGQPEDKPQQEYNAKIAAGES